MKKIIYIILVTISSAITFSSCTEEKITPQQDASPVKNVPPSGSEPF